MTEHSGLFAYKMFNEKLKLKPDEVWQIELGCGCIMETAVFTEEEKRRQAIACPIHLGLPKEVLRYRNTVPKVEGG